jgi:uncharacterized membrane protein
MFETLFKFPPRAFAEGDLLLALPAWQMLLALPVIVAAVALLLGYLRIRDRLGAADIAAISVLRGLAIAVVLFALSRPQLEVVSTIPQPGVIAILLDNSLSMHLDDDGEARHAFIGRELDPDSGQLLRSLRADYEIRLLRYGAETAPLDDIAGLDYADGASDLAQALRFAREALEGEPLAGLVVIGDGANASAAALESEIPALRAAATPVFGIGLGETSYARDIEISSVRLPRKVLAGSRVIAEVQMRQRGYDGAALELRIEDDSRILHKQPISLDGESPRFEIPLEAADGGARRLRFSVAVQDGEAIAENNRNTAMLNVVPERKRILYFEGEPRFELKFVRRAVSGDEQLAVTGLVRTADAKFYRVGIESQSQLREGFPTTREELFAYDALILGSVEASLLSREQQQMIVDFVSRRGGGLLLLGGRHAFAAGGYHDSELRALFPVVMEAQPGDEFSRQLRIRPTPAALVHPALGLAEDPQVSAARWLTLPPLTVVNPLRRVKPGATLLLTAESAAGDESWVALAFQRYGRGKVAAFPIQNSWLWQMHQDIELEDQTHETLWRRLLRWIVEDVPGRIDMQLSSERLHSGARLVVQGEIMDSEFNPREDAEARALLLTPGGLEQVVPLAPVPDRRGVYRAEIGVSEAGDYHLQIETGDDSKTLRSAETRLLVSAAGDEYYASELNADLLRNLAAQTGGAYLEPEDSGRIAELLQQRQRGARLLMRHELWDMPLLFALLVVLLCAEWTYRRWRRLA